MRNGLARCAQRRSLRLTAWFGAALSATPSAQAHNTVEGVGDALAGFLHVVSGPEHVLPIIALGLLAGQQGIDRLGASSALFALAFIAGAAAVAASGVTPDLPVIGQISLIALGAWIALARPLPVRAFAAVAIVLGVVLGAVNGEARISQMSLVPFVLGAVLGAQAVMGTVMLAANSLARPVLGWTAIAVRALGSWLAAIGLMTLALGLRQVTG